MSHENLQQENNPEPTPGTQTEPPTSGAGSLLGGDGAPQPTEEAPSVAPETVDGYEVKVDGFDFEEFKAIDENKQFLERAHKVGLNNDQMNFLLGEYNELIPNLINADAQLDTEACKAALNEVWGGETNANLGFAHQAAQNAIQEGILTQEDVMNPAFGNNPIVLKAMAYFGKQLGEDRPPNNTQPTGSQDIQSLISSEAYMNDKHPDHKSVNAQVERYYQKNFN